MTESQNRQYFLKLPEAGSQNSRTGKGWPKLGGSESETFFTYFANELAYLGRSLQAPDQSFVLCENLDLSI
jgi:hypothetical protein